MKNLSAISKKGIILVSAVIMIMAGTFVALSPSTSRACGPGMRGAGSSFVHVPILNNVGETLTIRKMFINVPDVTDVCKKWMGHDVCSGTCSKEENEMRVKTISFDGSNHYTSGSDATSHCHKHGEDPDKIIDHSDYSFSGESVECQIEFDVCDYDLPSGTYSIRYYFRYNGDTEDRTNTVTFSLP